METRQLSYTEAFLLIADLWDRPHNIGTDEVYVEMNLTQWGELLRDAMQCGGICECIYAMSQNKTISKETAQMMLRAVMRAKPKRADPDGLYWPTTAEGAIKRASVCREAAAWLPTDCFS